MESEDFCSQISIIPQYLGTCWLNAILMNSFYSQAMRKLMINKVSKTWNKTNKLLKFFKTILKKNYNTEDKKIIEMFYKTRPELLLIKYIKLYDTNIAETIKKNIYKFHSIYISIFLKNLNVKVLDILYYDKYNKYLLNSYKHIINLYGLKNKDLSYIINKDNEEEEILKILKDIPDVLIIHTKNIENLYDYNDLLKKNNNIEIHESDKYNINKESLEDIKYERDEIHFLGYIYKLDSIILRNYNIDKGAHVISGITCNNNKYIYNGWCKGTIDEGLEQQEKKEIFEPYPLIKYDWTITNNKKFCFKPDYSEEIYPENLCFSFNLGYRILIYVKNNKEELSSIIRSSTYSDLSSKKKDLKEFYSDIKTASSDDLIEYLYKKRVIFNYYSNIETLRKILYNTLKKESGLLKKDKKYEYYTSLPIKEYNDYNLLKIENNYYLIDNLFYDLFILNTENTYNNLLKTNNIKTPDNLKIPINEIKKIIYIYFLLTDIKEIYNNYIRNKTNLFEKIKENFIYTEYNVNNSILANLFIKIYGIYFFITMFNLPYSIKTKEFLNIINDKKNEFKVIQLFNSLDLHLILTVNEFISYLILITKNIIENIPSEEQIKIGNNIYNVVLLFYYYIYNNNSGFSLENRKKIIFKYYNIELDNYDLLMKEIEKEENKENILKNINPELKGGRKKLLKRY